MTISTLRDVAAHWHVEWDVNTGVRINGRNIRLNFHRWNIIPGWVGYTAKMVRELGWSADTKLAIVGGGFGMMEEALVANHGFTSVLTCDDSIWIQGAKGETEDADVSIAIAAVGGNPFSGEGMTKKAILSDGGFRARVTVVDEDILTNASRAAVRSMLGGVDVAFTDDMLDRITDADALAFSVGANLIGAQVVHSVGGANSFRLNAKETLQEWKDLIPADTFINWKTGEVL